MKNEFLALLILLFFSKHSLSNSNDPCSNLLDSNENMTSQCHNIYGKIISHEMALENLEDSIDEVSEAAVLTEIFQKIVTTIKLELKKIESRESDLNNRESSKEVKAFQEFYHVIRSIQNSDALNIINKCENSDCKEDYSLETQRCKAIQCDKNNYHKNLNKISALQAQKTSLLMRYPHLTDEKIIDEIEKNITQNKETIENNKIQELLTHSFTNKKEELHKKIQNMNETLKRAKQSFNGGKFRTSGRNKTSNKANLNRISDHVYDDFLPEISSYLESANSQSQYQFYGPMYCKMRKKVANKMEFKENMKLATDIGLFIAPMFLGGPLGLIASTAIRGAIGAARFTKIMQLGFKGASLGKMGQFALGEALFAGVDAKMLNDKARQCIALQNQFQSSPSENSLKSVDNCKEEYDKELKQTLAMAGLGVAAEGVIASGKTIKNVLEASSKMNVKKLERASKSYRNKMGVDLPKLDEVYLASQEAKDVMKRARFEAKKINPALTEEMLDQIALGAAHAHRVEIDTGLITQLKNDKLKGEDTFSRAGKEAKLKIMEAYGVDATIRRALMEKGITGRTAPDTLLLHPNYTIHKNDPTKIKRIEVSDGISFKDEFDKSLQDYIPKDDSGKKIIISKMDKEDLSDYLSTIDLADIRGGLSEVILKVDKSADTLDELYQQTKMALKKKPGEPNEFKSQVTEFYATRDKNFLTYEAGETLFKIIGDGTGQVKVLMSSKGSKAVEIPIENNDIKRKLNSSLGMLVSADRKSRGTGQQDNLEIIFKEAQKTVQSQMLNLFEEASKSLKMQSSILEKKVKETESLQKKYRKGLSGLTDDEAKKVSNKVSEILQ